MSKKYIAIKTWQNKTATTNSKNTSGIFHLWTFFDFWFFYLICLLLFIAQRIFSRLFISFSRIFISHQWTRWAGCVYSISTETWNILHKQYLRTLEPIMNGIRGLHLKEVRDDSIIFNTLGQIFRIPTRGPEFDYWNEDKKLYLRDGIWNFLDSEGYRTH